MDYIVVKTVEGEVTISVDKIVTFRDTLASTEINLLDGTHVYATGTLSEELRKSLRMSKYQIEKIGE